LGDTLDDLHLFVENYPSTVLVRAHFDPHVHSLHDQYLQIGVIVDPYEQQLEEVSLSDEEIGGSVEQVL
jgi:hypothetical protein